MIEMVFVIVIIGILASVALPKMSAMKDEARASQCVHEVGQFLSEIATRYTSTQSFQEWETMTLSGDITNITLNAGEGDTGIVNGNDLIHDTLVEYQCDGEKIVDVLASTNASTLMYQIVLTIVDTPASPASLKAANILEEQYTGLTRTFQL